MAITDDNVKTRGQKEKLEEISAPDQADGNSVSAEEATGEEKGEEENGGESKGEEAPPKVPRDGTMVITAKVRV
jgi:hypothetical protein